MRGFKALALPPAPCSPEGDLAGNAGGKGIKAFPGGGMMITYEYECEACGLIFEHRHAIKDTPPGACPKCQGKIHQRISGGSGFIIRGGTEKQIGRQSGGCSLESSGRTCCGREERCDKPPCEGRS